MNVLNVYEYGGLVYLKTPTSPNTNKLVLYLPKILTNLYEKIIVFPRQGHQKQTTKVEKTTGNQQTPMYIYMVVDPPVPPKPQEIKTPKTGTHWKTVLHNRVHTHTQKPKENRPT